MRCPQLSHRLWMFAKSRLYQLAWNNANALRKRRAAGIKSMPWKGRGSVNPATRRRQRLAKIAKWCRSGRTLHCIPIKGTTHPTPDSIALIGDEPWVFDEFDFGWAPSMEAGHAGQLASAASVAIYDAYDEVHGDIMVLTDQEPNNYGKKK